MPSVRTITKEIDNLMVGNSQVSRAYIGDTIVWMRNPTSGAMLPVLTGDVNPVGNITPAGNTYWQFFTSGGRNQYLSSTNPWTGSNPQATLTLTTMLPAGTYKAQFQSSAGSGLAPPSGGMRMWLIYDDGTEAIIATIYSNGSLAQSADFVATKKIAAIRVMFALSGAAGAMGQRTISNVNLIKQ